jgi:acyl-coenzyme A thioesterase PaaI-like protein
VKNNMKSNLKTTNLSGNRYKSNFLSPAIGEEYHCIGKVVKAGKTLTVTIGEVYAVKNGERKLISVMQATMMAIYEDRK